MASPRPDVGVADVAGEGRSDDAQIRLGAPSQTAIRGGGDCRSPSPSVRVGQKPRSIGRLPQEPPQRPPQHARGPSRGRSQKERQAHAARATSIASTPQVEGPGFEPAGCRCRPVPALAESRCGPDRRPRSGLCRWHETDCAGGTKRKEGACTERRCLRVLAGVD
jgi:hypothetical protein